MSKCRIFLHPRYIFHNQPKFALVIACMTL